MRRTQIYLDEDVDERLRRTARQRGQSAAALIRDAVDEFLAREAAASLASDPWEAFVGVAGGTDTDVSVNHDAYLYGMSKDEARALDRQRAARST